MLDPVGCRTDAKALGGGLGRGKGEGRPGPAPRPCLAEEASQLGGGQKRGVRREGRATAAKSEPGTSIAQPSALTAGNYTA